jgi:hypothetical protein
VTEVIGPVLLLVVAAIAVWLLSELASFRAVDAVRRERDRLDAIRGLELAARLDAGGHAKEAELVREYVRSLVS